MEIFNPYTHPIAKQIKNCKWISDDRKKLAIKELNRIRTSNEIIWNENVTSLSSAFYWGDSELGYMFWMKINYDLNLDIINPYGK